MRFNQERVLWRRLRAVSQWLQRETQIWPKTPAQWKDYGSHPDFPPTYQGPADPDIEAAFWCGMAQGARTLSDRMSIISDVLLKAYPDFEIEVTPETVRQTLRLVVDNTSAGLDAGFKDDDPLNP